MPARAAIRTHFQRPHLTAGDPGGGDEHLHQVSWDDPTAGLAGGTADVAVVWLHVGRGGRRSMPVGPAADSPAGQPRGDRLAREGVITRPVRGLSPTQLALAWRTGDHRPLVVDYAPACQQ